MSQGCSKSCYELAHCAPCATDSQLYLGTGTAGRTTMIVVEKRYDVENKAAPVPPALALATISVVGIVAVSQPLAAPRPRLRTALLAPHLRHASLAAVLSEHGTVKTHAMRGRATLPPLRAMSAHLHHAAPTTAPPMASPRPHLGLLQVRWPRADSRYAPAILNTWGGRPVAHERAFVWRRVCGSWRSTRATRRRKGSRRRRSRRCRGRRRASSTRRRATSEAPAPAFEDQALHCVPNCIGSSPKSQPSPRGPP